MENSKIDDLLVKARLLPSLPGVYKMLDKSGKVIYVGKSKSLKNRVSQYFQNYRTHSVKTRKMVENVFDFECVFTNTENEALVLENELIKLFSPKFNVRLKDDKSYPYIKLSTSEQFPRLSMVRSLNVKRTKNDLYFGPYSSTSSVYAIIDTVSKLFKLPVCKQSFPKDFGKARPCLNYHINRCKGLCMGKITSDEYRETIRSVISFLKHDYEGVIKELQSSMEQFADELRFEEAIEARNLISSIKNLRQHQKILFEDKVERDVFGVFSDDISSCIAVTVVRDGRIIDNERFLFSGDEILDSDTFAHFVGEYYKKREYIPREILFQRELYSESFDLLKSFLSLTFEKNIKFIFPEKAALRRAVEMAVDNAKEYCLHNRNIESKTDEKLFELASILHLEVLPEVIEAYDISNSGDEYITAGMICVKRGSFYKKGYKLFNIKNESQDDYSSMAEALDRRCKRYIEELAEKGTSDAWELPDLILVDGGNNHVSVAKKVIEDNGLDISVFGMVKDSHHKTRTLCDGVNEISIAHNTRIFNFIYSIQEEIHRFTFGAMDNKRRRALSHYSIESIKGIGPKKAKALMSHFKTIKALSQASEDELLQVPRITQNDVLALKKYFDGKKTK